MSVRPAFVFLFEDNEPAGARVARCARQLAEPGLLCAHIRAEDYVSFLGIRGRAEQLRFGRTSCAIVAGTVLGHCGHPLKAPWKLDGTWGITSWLNLSFGHKAWREDKDPPVGSVLYWGSKTGSNGHVGILVEQLPDGLGITVEGGGSLSGTEAKVAGLTLGLTTAQIKQTNGTVCRMSKPKDYLVSAGRKLAGYWHPEFIGLPAPMVTP